MRVLVLRPEFDSKQTAKLLQKRGHKAIVAPITEIEPQSYIFNVLPDLTAIIATSANAFRCLADSFPIIHKALPCLTVGTNTADAAKKAGFTETRSGYSNAVSLAEIIGATFPIGSKFLYITGRPRKPELENTLKKLGYTLQICETYKAKTVMQLPQAAVDAFNIGVDVVLHFSRHSAKSAVMLFEQAGLMKQAQQVNHICLSKDVAEALHAFSHIRIAAKPEQAAMLDLLNP